MKLDSIGQYIRKYRLSHKLRQEDLAEKTGLSPNYIGMVERGEKIPSLETFICIANTLGVSADMLLVEVLDTGYTVKSSQLLEQTAKLTPEDRNRIFDVIETMINHSRRVKYAKHRGKLLPQCFWLMYLYYRDIGTIISCALLVVMP